MTMGIVLKIARKMAKQLLLTGAVLALSIMLMQLNQALGIIVLMGYSSVMVVQGSKKEMPLGTFTALLPGAISLLCFLFMLSFVGVSNIEMPLAGIGLGVIPGFLMARGHTIFEKDGRPYAKRTFFYILIWAASLLFTQGSTLLGLRQIMDFGFLLNGFSTTMAVILSIFLFTKAKSISGPKAPAGGALATFILVMFSMAVFAFAVPKSAKATFADPYTNPSSVVDIGQYVFKGEKDRLSLQYLRVSSQTNRSNLGQEGYQETYTSYSKIGKKKEIIYGGQILFQLFHNSLNRAINPEAEIRQNMKHLHDINTNEMGNYKGNTYRAANGSAGTIGYGYYWIIPVSRKKELSDSIKIIALWAHNGWYLKFTYQGTPRDQGGMIGNHPIRYVEGLMRRASFKVTQLESQWGRSYQSQRGDQPAPVPQPSPVPQTQRQPPPQPQQTPTPNNQEGESNNDFASVLEQLNQNAGNDSFQDYLDREDQEPEAEGTSIEQPDEPTAQEVEEYANYIEQVLAAIQHALQGLYMPQAAVAAGMAVAIAQLLAGLGMSAAYAAALEVAASVEYDIDHRNDPRPSSAPKTEEKPPPGAPDEPWPHGQVLKDENNEPWYPNEDGEYGLEDANGDITWMSKEEAELSIEEELDGRKRRDKERENFWGRVEKDRETRLEQREQNLKNSGFVYNDEKQAWSPYEKKTPDNPYGSRKEEIYERGDYIRNHIHELSEDQQKIAERILDRAGASVVGVNEDDISDKDLSDIQQLSNVVSHITTGHSQTEMAQAEHDAIDQDSNIAAAGNMITAGKMAATVIEMKTPVGLFTRGALSGFIGGGVDEYVMQDAALGERDWVKIAKNATITSGFNVLGGALGDVKKGSVLWNASTGSVVDGAEAWAKGKNAEEIKAAAQFGFVANGVFEHVKNVDAKGTSLFDFSGKAPEADVNSPSTPTRSNLPDGDPPVSRAPDISTRGSDIGARTTDIGSRGSDLSSRAEDIGSKATDIGSRGADISSRAEDIGSRATDIDSREADISSRAEDINTTDTDMPSGVHPSNVDGPSHTPGSEEAIDLLSTQPSQAVDTDLNSATTRPHESDMTNQGFDPNATRNADTDFDPRAQDAEQGNATHSDEPSTAAPEQRAPATEEEVLQGIRDHTAQNEVIKRAEAASQGGPIAAEDCPLVDSRKDWKKWDQIVGGGERPIMNYGFNRTTVVQDAIDSGEYKWLDRVDIEIREAYRQSDISSPNSWERVEVQLKNRNISMEQFDAWHSITKGEVVAVSTDTVVPD